MQNLKRLALIFTLTPLAGCIITSSGDSDTDDPAPGTTTNAATGDETAAATEAGDETAAPATDDGATESGDPIGGACVHQCTGDQDCLIGGKDVGLTCVEDFCTGETPDPCKSDDECIALFSGWSGGIACTAGGGECEAAMQVCLDVGGEGHCAAAPSEFFACADAMLDEIDTTDIDGNDVTVCGNAGAACGDDGVCFDACASDDDCAAESAPVCNTGTGLCECGTDADCETLGQPHLSVCNGGTCGCGEDQHCVDGNAGDVCGDGLCGCSGAEACANVANNFDGGEVRCVNL